MAGKEYRTWVSQTPGLTAASIRKEHPYAASIIDSCENGAVPERTPRDHYRPPDLLERYCLPGELQALGEEGATIIAFGRWKHNSKKK